MKSISLTLILILLLCELLTFSQTDPGTVNLTNQWTFDDGTATDLVGSANGTLMGAAVFSSKALNTSGGGYLSFPGATIAVHTYSALSTEIWFTSSVGANTVNTMISYFGEADIDGWMGNNYIFTSPVNGGNTRVAISTGNITNNPWVNEDGVNTTSIDDGSLHHFATIVDSTSITLYIDGALIASTALSGTNTLANVNSATAFLCKGGYSGDATWKGLVHKYSIYNKALSADEVAFLYQLGAEQSPMIVSTLSKLSFDSLYLSETLGISGSNLTDSITITAPAGITLNPSKLAPDVSGATVSVIYDGITAVDGELSVLSGATELNIVVKSFSNDCYSNLYANAENMIVDPYVSSLDNFSGWGNRNINTDPDYVFCGATSGMVYGSNGGSLDVTLTGKLLTKTNYRVKAKVYTIGGKFQVGIFGWSNGQPDYTKSVSITDSWQDLDFNITTGSTLGNTQGLFFNNYGLSGTRGYIDNWEMYAIPKVYTSEPEIHFSTTGSKTITLRAVSLSEDISITTTSGFSVSHTTMLSDVNGDSLTITFNNASSIDGYVYFTSGSIKDSLFVSGSVEPTILTSVKVVSVDEIDNSTSFTVTGFNLQNEITFSAPAGISFYPTSLPPTANYSAVSVIFDGKAISSGTISIISGSATRTIDLIAVPNKACFEPLYQDAINLIIDPTCNYYTEKGWGDKSINTDPEFVYCGSRSAKITNDGSYDRDLTGLLKPNTEYRMRVKVYKASPVKNNNMGNVTYTLAMDSVTLPESYRLIKEAMDSACSYFNKHTPFIENIYVYYNQGIPTAQASYHGSIGFGPNTRYMWVGTAIHEMAHYFGSGTSEVWQAHIVSGAWTGTVANSLANTLNRGSINGDKQHYWPYGINQKEEITNLGSMKVQDKALADAVRIIKAMLVDDCDLPTNNPPVGLGIYGWNADSSDIYEEVTIVNSWQDVDITFTTGDVLKENHGLYINRGSAYIDNWELYEVPIVLPPSSITGWNTKEPKVYFQHDRIVAEFELIKKDEVNFQVYDLQGKLLFVEDVWCEAGFNKQEIQTHLPVGIYIVRMVNYESSFSKKGLIW